MLELLIDEMLTSLSSPLSGKKKKQNRHTLFDCSCIVELSQNCSDCQVYGSAM